MSHTTASLNEAYVATIIEAIKNRRAAIMIGSGFSKNAKNGHLMPSWSELAAHLSCGTSKIATAAVSDILELAETYTAAYGRSDLDRILLEKTGNKSLNVTPSELYKDLLGIPWSDIFTTNYDTLLEDAAYEFRREIDYEFNVVNTVNDIAFSKGNGKTRIVKLHGSFPSHRPFIITEEDYRTYENEFSPFVNTVQQSMLENVFCLIGFSSADPNFKNWMGWVRDNLGDHQPPIYLITASDEPVAKQQYLLKKNIRVVNISYLADEKNSPNKHYSALKGFLGRIQEELMWRDSSEWKMDLPKQDSAEPWDNYYQTRKSYPGWTVPPFKYIHRLWWHFNLSRKPKADEFSIKSFIQFYDMIWLMDKSTFPLHDYVEQLDGFLKSSVELLNSTRDLEELIRNVTKEGCNQPSGRQYTKQAFLVKWEHLGVVLLKYLFTSQNREYFHEWIANYSEFIKRNGLFLLEDTAQYFQILFALSNFDGKQAKILLDKWKMKSSDILLQTKQALLYNEVGNLKKCIEMLENCKNKVNDVKIFDENFYQTTSIKQWIVFYYTEFKKVYLDFISYGKVSKEEINEQKAKLDQEINKNPSTAEVRSFFQSASRELDTALAFKHDKDYFTFENSSPIVQKEKIVHSGFPSFYFALCIWSWFDDLLNFASKIDHIRYNSKNKSSLMKLEILSNGFVSRQSLASLVRGASPSLFKNESILFARSSLKLLTEEQKENLVGYTTDHISIFISDDINKTYDGDVINFSFELLGRLCFVLNVEQRESVLSLAIRLYTAPKIHFFYQEKFMLFFKLVLESQSASVLSKNIDKLFKLPVIQKHHQKDISIWEQYWNDPFEIVSAMPIGKALELSEEDSVKYAIAIITDLKNLQKNQVSDAGTSHNKLIANALPTDWAIEIQPLLENICGDNPEDSHRKIYHNYINRLIWIMKHAQNQILIQELVKKHLKNLLINCSQYNFAHWVSLMFFSNFSAYKVQFLENLDNYSLQDIHFSLKFPDEYFDHIQFTIEELQRILARLQDFALPEPPRENPFFSARRYHDVDYITYTLSTFFCNNSALLRGDIAWIEKLIASQKNHKQPYYQLEFIRLRACSTTNFDNFIYQLEDALRSENFADIHDACAVLLCWRFACNESEKPQELETMLVKSAKDCTNDRSVALLNNICNQIKKYGLSEKELNILYIVLNKNFIILSDDTLNIQQAEILENIFRSKCSFPQRRYYCAKVVYELASYACAHDKKEILTHDIIETWIASMEKDSFSDTQNLYFLTQNVIQKAHIGKEEGHDGQA